jgi:hypothetical protein
VSNTASALELLKQAEALLESDVATTPTQFGPATIVSISSPATPFDPPNTVGPFTIVLQPTNDPTNPAATLTLKVSDKPPGAVQGAICTGSYLQGSPVDTISSFALSATLFTGMLAAAPPPGTTTPPYPYTFVPKNGTSGLLTLNLATLDNSLVPGVWLSFSYLLAAQNGTSYDEILGTVTQTAL